MGFFKKRAAGKDKHGSDDYKYLALHDDMTGLFNKRGYEDYVKDFMACSANILYVDINDLKKTNHELGYDKGNTLIRKIAQTINEFFPDEGYRIGDDDFIVINTDLPEEEMVKKIEDIKGRMEYLSSSNPDNLTFSISIGYAILQDGEKIEDAVKAAEAEMLKEKQAYKLKNMAGISAARPKEYNELLTKDQQGLKIRVAAQHEEVLDTSVERIMDILKEKDDEIEAILITNSTFDYLFIFIDTSNFYSMLQKTDCCIDFSYLYVLYAGGPLYYGNDEYTSEITHLFEDIGRALLERKIRSREDLIKIKGINIFKEIYSDI